MPTPLSLLAGETQRGAGAFGTVPTVPSPQETQEEALGGDIGQLANVRAIQEQLNQQAAVGAQYPLLLNLPNYQQAAGQAMGNVQQLLGGQVPGDVWNQIQQMAAERGTAMGSPMSPNANAAMLRALGLTSLGLQQQGQQSLTNLMQAVPRAPLFDPTGLLVSPGQQQEWQYLANQLAAAPSPTEAAREEMSAIAGGAGFGQGMGYVPQQTYARPTGGMSGDQASAAFAADALARQSGATRAAQEEEARSRAYLASPAAYSSLPFAGMTAPAGTGQVSAAPVIDQQGDEWVQLGAGSWMNLSTGAMSGAPPSSPAAAAQYPPEYGYWPETDVYQDQQLPPEYGQYYPEPANVETPIPDSVWEDLGFY